MTKPYLPAWATAQEAAEWLQAETGEPWPLPRLIESGAMPHVWLTPDPDDLKNSEVFDVVFEGRHEGFMAPVVFAGDTHRIAADRTGTLSMTRAQSGALVRFTPPLSFDVDKLRFDAERVRRLVAPSAPEAAEPTPEAAPPLEDWKMRVQAEAAAHWLHLRKLHCNPTKHGILPHLAKWCRENNIRTAGPSGIHPSEGYLKNVLVRWEPPR